MGLLDTVDWQLVVLSSGQANRSLGQPKNLSFGGEDSHFGQIYWGNLGLMIVDVLGKQSILLSAAKFMDGSSLLDVYSLFVFFRATIGSCNHGVRFLFWAIESQSRMTKVQEYHSGNDRAAC